MCHGLFRHCNLYVVNLGCYLVCYMDSRGDYHDKSSRTHKCVTVDEPYACRMEIWMGARGREREKGGVNEE